MILFPIDPIGAFAVPDRNLAIDRRERHGWFVANGSVCPARLPPETHADGPTDRRSHRQPLPTPVQRCCCRDGSLKRSRSSMRWSILLAAHGTASRRPSVRFGRHRTWDSPSMSDPFARAYIAFRHNLDDRRAGSALHRGSDRLSAERSRADAGCATMGITMSPVPVSRFGSARPIGTTRHRIGALAGATIPPVRPRR